MAVVQSNGVVNLSGGLNLADFKRIIAAQQREIMVKDERLRGVEELTRICSEKEERCKSLQVRAQNYQNALQRAETRVAVLSKKLGIGPQTAFKVDVVNSDVSRREFEVLSQERDKFKEALEHIVATKLGGHDVVLKNKELYELVTTLQDDIEQRDKHIKELQEMLAYNSDDLAAKINELMQQKMMLERVAKAKQVFSEKLLKENNELKHKIRNQKLDEGQSMTDGQVVVSNVSEQSSILNAELEKLKKSIAEKEELLSQQETQMQEMAEKLKSVTGNEEKLTRDLEKAKEMQTKCETELKETSRKCADFQKKCQGFFKQVESLNSKQQEAEEELAALKRTNENLRADVAERRAMITMMTDSLKTYENDFQTENKEKGEIKRRYEVAQRESERLKRENQSHMATIRHFESEIERLNKLVTEERSRGKGTSGFGTSLGNVFGSTASRSLFQDHQRQQVVVADGGGGVNEVADGVRSRSSKPDPPQRSSPSLIECPYCSRSYPYHLIEGHVQDCMEDSLYMDD